MSVEKQHLEPALQSISSRSGQSLRITGSSLTYINQCLDYLLSRIDTLYSHIQLYNSHQAAVDAVVATARAEMAQKVPEPAKAVQAAETFASPVKRQARRDAKPRRRSSGVNEPPALETLMKSLSLPTDTLASSSTKDQFESLHKTLRDRSANEQAVARDAQVDFEETAKTRLADAKRAIQLIRDTLFAETSFGEVNLVDQGIEQSILVLGQEVEKAKDKLAGFEGTKTSWGSSKKDEFLERWAR